MSTVEIMVVLGGATAIGWIHWYFFVASRAAASAEVGERGQEVRVEVRGGYDPGTVRARRDLPLRLVFDRQETSSCSEEVVFPDFGIRRFLPAYQETVVDLAPSEAGTFEFTCGMGMLRGRLVVEDT